MSDELQADDDADSPVPDLLLGMALDAPPPVTVPDEMPPVRGPLDAVYAALVAAANASDAQSDAEAYEAYQRRQGLYRKAIEDAT